MVILLLLTQHQLQQAASEARQRTLMSTIKTLLANVSCLQKFFNIQSLNNLNNVDPMLPRRTDQGQRKTLDRLLNIFKYKETLFDCFEQFTGVFFQVAANVPSDAELRVTLLEFYQ